MALPLDKSDAQLYTHMLQGMVVMEVEEEIRKKIMPKINKVIKQLALDATKKWAIKIKSEIAADKLTNQTNITVSFVEEVVRTISVPSDITFELKDKK